MAKFNIMDNLGDLGSAVFSEEIRLLLPVADEVLGDLCDDVQDTDECVEEVSTGEGGIVREGLNDPPGRT